MKLLATLILMLITQGAQAKPYKYEVRKKDAHIIHIVTLNPKDYEVKFVKAHNQVFGRETVRQIAEREDADIAINAGFFEIDGSQDGMPSRNMIVDGRVFSLVPGKQDNLILSKERLSIESHSIDVSARLGESEISINKYNKFPSKDDVVLYTDAFGSSTLTNYANRQELAFDKNYKLIKLYDHGNIDIPQRGFVLSLPKSQNLHGAELKLIDKERILQTDTKVSMITGIPGLISGGVINPKILEQKSDFYKKPHARTAIGIRKDEYIVLVIAEYSYTKDLNDVTLDEVREVIQKKAGSIEKQYNKKVQDLTLNEIKEVVKGAYASSDSSVGLTIPELANLMLDLGCDSAINLDGGGSSALWLDGKIVSRTTGDEDEGLGKIVERPISDVIIFKKK